MFLVSTCCCVLAVKIKTLIEKHNSFTVPGGVQINLVSTFGRKIKKLKKKNAIELKQNRSNKFKIIQNKRTRNTIQNRTA